MAVHVINEAKRCLNCKKPMCRAGCPINTPIPDMIHTFITGGINDAGQMLFQNNPLSLVCSLVCNHENQCEGHCVLNRKGSGIHVSSIENYISDNYLDKLKPVLSPRKNIRCAIIGSGPAGITIAIVLAARGYDVTIFESRDQIGGVLRYGIPEFRLPKTILDRYKKLMTSMGIRIRPNTSIGAAIGVDDLFRDEYRSIFIGTGVWKPNTLGVKGESLGNVHYAIDYLSNPDAYSLGETVNVIGAGNAAMDVARTALRKGAQTVTVFSRAGTVAASQHETEYAMMDGVSFEYCKSPVELTDEGAIFREVEEKDDGSFIEIPGTEKLFAADSTIISISQGPRSQIVSTTYGIDVNERGLIITDANGHTTRRGVFASGDVVKGAKTVVEAVRYSKQVADAMDQFMREDAVERGQVLPPDTANELAADAPEAMEDFDFGQI